MHQEKKGPSVAAGAVVAHDSNAGQHSSGAAPKQSASVSIPFTEDAVALKFAQRNVGRVRYISAVTTRHKWFVKSGFVIGEWEWQVDDTLWVLDLIWAICREEAEYCNDPHLAREMLSADFISGVERLARSDQRLAATKEMGLPKKKQARKRKAVQP